MLCPYKMADPATLVFKYHVLITYSTTRVLDHDTRQRWEDSHASSKTIPTFEELQEFLRNRVIAIAAGQAQSTKSNSSEEGKRAGRSSEISANVTGIGYFSVIYVMGTMRYEHVKNFGNWQSLNGKNRYANRELVTVALGLVIPQQHAHPRSGADFAKQSITRFSMPARSGPRLLRLPAAKHLLWKIVPLKQTRWSIL